MHVFDAVCTRCVWLECPSCFALSRLSLAHSIDGCVIWKIVDIWSSDRLRERASIFSRTRRDSDSKH